MIILPILAALGASFGWAAGIVLAQQPAQQLGSFEFTRIQLIACSAILAAICSGLGYWQSVDWSHWPAFAASICIGIILGNLAMIECLRRGGPRRTELLLSLKAPPRRRNGILVVTGNADQHRFTRSDALTLRRLSRGCFRQ